MQGMWILIPAHNEEPTLGAVVRGCRAHCPNVLVVDDGSTDGTHRAAERAGCHLLRHQHNRGKGEALKAGFRWLLERDCRAVITLDADGQHDPAEIPKFLEHYRALKPAEGEGVLVMGSRVIDRHRMPLYRAIPSRFGDVMISLAARRPISDTQSGFRLYSRGVIERIQCRSRGFAMETEILIKASRNGVRIGRVPIRTIYQQNYTSHFRPVQDFYRISMVVLKHLV